MKFRHSTSVGIAVLLAVLTGVNCPAADPQDSAKAAERLFVLKILPLLKTKCFGCHGNDVKDIKGGFDVRSRQALLKGGESEESAMVPGKPEDSPLYLAVIWDGLEMPPKQNDRLSKQETEFIRQWIVAGAPWPDATAQLVIQKREWSVIENEDGIIVPTSGGLADSWTYRRYRRGDLWAFRPVRKPAVPEMSNVEQGISNDEGKSKPSTDLNFDIHNSLFDIRHSHNPVDRFLNKTLVAAKVNPAPQANARTLIRRATFDLTGLPPTPDEVTRFLTQWKRAPKPAWNDLIDRLLASPHYGERWGQHWLDVTRYADTGGMSNDFERSNLWRYRDYVIRSFNNDKPYDQFVIEQLAGDELADDSVRQRKGGGENAVLRTQLNGDYTDQEAEWIVATGFLRLGPWDNAMITADEARQIYLDDIVNVVGQTFLSTTMRCFKCHDHKFDPLPTRDYYRMYAAFATAQMAERAVPLLPTENLAGFDEGQAHVERMRKFAIDAKNKLIAKREAAARQWFAEHKLPYKNDQQRRNLPDEIKPPRHVGLDHVEQGQLKVREQDEWIWTRRLERYQPMAQSVYNASRAALAWNGARKLRIDNRADRKKRPDTFILTGGALTAKGTSVGPGVLSATGLAIDAKADDPYLLSDDVSGRRLALARWIAHPANPLTARSIVNRIWQHHFGRGIAGNPNNFGAKGAKPTHPKLLDYLATDFVENGWKIKRMHRLIMTSAAYRQSSRHPNAEKLRIDDPNNALLAYFRPRRLTAEELRDSMLSVTGELNRATGGLPVMPEINMEVALQPRMIQFSLAPASQPSRTPAQRNRRTIYAYRVRGQSDPFLELFNQPNPNDSCEARDVAAVTPQALTLLNSDVATDRSIAFALRLRRESATAVKDGKVQADDEPAFQIQRAFALALGRDPTASEQSRMLAYVSDMRRYHKGVEVEPVNFPTEITRSLVEEFSGAVFEYTEILPVFERYVADKKAADVSAETRAVADMCLLLLNTNEFLFVD